MCLSSDGTRLYTTSSDATIYVYDTSQLTLGHAPEMSRPGPPPYKYSSYADDGPDPLYGFRYITWENERTEFISLAVRPSGNGHSELLAASSPTDTVLFPTAEVYWNRGIPVPGSLDNSSLAGSPQARPLQFERRSQDESYPDRVDTIPIYHVGTRLRQAERAEPVSSYQHRLTWTMDGKRVTMGKGKGTVERWREDRLWAAHYRHQASTYGPWPITRHMPGWAEVEAHWDDDRDHSCGEEDEG